MSVPVLQPGRQVSHFGRRHLAPLSDTSVDSCSYGSVNSASLLLRAADVIGAVSPAAGEQAASPAPLPDPNRVSAGGLGFAFLLFMIGATALLFYSMRRQLKRVRFDENAGEAGARDVAVFPRRTEGPSSEHMNAKYKKQLQTQDGKSIDQIDIRTSSDGSAR
jgi:hypothetical protein